MHTMMRTIGLLSLTGGITFLLFCFLRLGLRKKVSARWQNRALLLLTLFWLIPIGSFYPQEQGTVYTPQLNTAEVHAGLQQSVAAMDIVRPAVDSSWLFYGYCLVAAVCFLRFLLQYRRQCQYLRKNSWAVTDDDAQKLFCALLGQQQITRAVQLRCSPVIQAPVLVGLRNYQILLPNRTLQTEQVKLILNHELAHVKYYDNWQKVYLEILRCVFWFHPCIYWLKSMADHLCELASDEQVVRDFDGAQRKQYGFLLLEMVQQGQAVELGCSGWNQKGIWMKKRLLHIVNYQTHTKPICCLFLCLFCLICAAGCGVSAAVEQQLPETSKTVQLEIMRDGKKIGQKSIKTFSWEQPEGEDSCITLYINGEAYCISGMDSAYYVFPAGLECYWEALAQLPEETLPENLNRYLRNLVLQAELYKMEWEEPAKPILTFSWEKTPGTDRTTLWINGEAYSYQILDDGNLLISGAVMAAYGETLQNISKEQMPEDLYQWFRDDAEVSASCTSLISSVELAPGERIECPNSIYFDGRRSTAFHVSCQYGDVAKLKVYRGYEKGDRDTSLGYFTATQGKWYGELNATISKGYWYFTIENGGSHNIMVDSVTVNF